MKKIIRVKLLKDPGAVGGFCMSVGSIVELYDGGFRNPEVNKNYYPVFGPYTVLTDIADQIMNGTATQEAIDLFEVVDVTDIMLSQVSLMHDVMDETGSNKLCSVIHRSLMTLLRDKIIENSRRGADYDFKLSDALLKNELMEHALPEDMIAIIEETNRNMEKINKIIAEHDTK